MYFDDDVDDVYDDDLLDEAMNEGGRYEKIGKPRDGVYMGIEYEVDIPEGKAKEFIRATKSLGHIGSDGSLNGRNGYPIEFRAHPMGFEKAITAWTRFFDKHGRTVAEEDNGGVHIHLTKGPIHDDVWGRMFYFINSDSNDYYIDHVANRSGNDYCERQDPTCSECGHLRVGYAMEESCHGNAMDCNASYGTVELRIFASTTDKATFLSYIEFTRALLDFCKRSTSFDNLTPQKFYAFLQTKKKRYPHILAVTKQYLRK